MRWIVRIAGIVVAVAVLLVVGLLLLPGDRIARLAADQLTQATGRQVTLGGAVGLTFWPVLGITADRLEVGNADWAGPEPMLTANAASVGIDARALLGGAIRIRHIAAQGPILRLARGADGRANWTFFEGDVAQDAAPAAAGTPRTVTLQALTITDATVIYTAPGAVAVTQSGVDLSLDWPEQDGPARLDALLRPAGAPVTISATVGDFAGFLSGAVQPVDARLEADGGSVTLAGRGALDGSVDGALTLDTADTARFVAALGGGAVALPEGLGRTARVTTQLTLTPDRRLGLRELLADLGGNRISGAADIVLGPVPHVTAELDAGVLDLSALGGSGEAAPGTPVPAPGWSEKTIDASGLGAFDGSIGLSAQSIDLGALQLGATRVRLTNDDRRMVVELTDVAAYGGRMAGQFVMNNRGGLSVGGQLQAQGVQMNPLLSDMAGVTRFTGSGDASLSFLGSGPSVAAILRSLSGSGALSVGRGTIEGIDLDNLLGSYDVQGGTTVFDALGATFDITQGVLRNEDLAMGLPRIEATGRGLVDLGARTLDYTVVPKVLRVNAGRGLAVPVRIVGPWADPKIMPDLQAAVDLNFAAERQAVEDRVTQKLDEKLQEELGVTRAQGQSVEDALKGGVEDRLRRELLKILQ